MNRAEIEAFLEPLLGALRRRDLPLLERLSRDIAAKTRRVRAFFVQRDREIDPEAHLLGTLEVMEAICLRATARHAANAQREAARKQGALKVLHELALSPEQTLLPSQLALRLKILRPNMSRLLKHLATVDLVTSVDRRGSGGTDARRSPIQLTEAGLQVLSELMPDWRTAEKIDRTESEHTEILDFEPEVAAVKRYGVPLINQAELSDAAIGRPAPSNLVVLSPRVRQRLHEPGPPGSQSSSLREKVMRRASVNASYASPAAPRPGTIDPEQFEPES